MIPLGGIDGAIEIPVKVVPKSAKIRITAMPEWLKVCVTAAPEKGKANAAVVDALKQHFGARVRIVSGETNQRKTVAISLTRAQVLEKLGPSQ